MGWPLATDQRFGGDGWYGTVGAGYDWQFNSSWVAGIFADGQFGSLRGSATDNICNCSGREKLNTSYAAGVRLGYLVAPNVLSYVNAGYTGSEWSGTTYTSVFGGAPVFTTPSFHRDGVFVGGGVENNLNIFGITAPGWFMKTEYRAAYYDRITLPETFVGGGATPDTAHLQAAGADRQHLAGLSVQLERTCGREILTWRRILRTESPGSAGAFLCRPPPA